jgi:excisionase family DNA binding protein
MKDKQARTKSDTLSVSVTEAARLLGVSPYSVRNYIRRGELPAIRLGRRVLLPLGRLRELTGDQRGGKA